MANNHRNGRAHPARTPVKTILVVDDEPVIGKMLTQVLSQNDYQVISFTSPKNALAYLENNTATVYPQCGPVIRHHCDRAHLLLTDLQMPEMTGIELARQVKTLYPALPIIVMSGLADGRDREEVFKLGADFIAKPFDIDELLRRVDLVNWFS